MFSNNAIARYQNLLLGKLKSNLLSLTRKISKVYFVNSFNDSSLFRNEFISKSPIKTFLGYFLPKPLKFLKVYLLGLQLYFTTVYGQRLTQFIYVALLCWTANNAMFLFIKFYVEQ